MFGMSFFLLKDHVISELDQVCCTSHLTVGQTFCKRIVKCTQPKEILIMMGYLIFLFGMVYKKTLLYYTWRFVYFLNVRTNL